MKFKRPSWIIIILYIAIFVVGGLIAQELFFYKTLAKKLHVAEVGQFLGPEDADKVIVEYVDYRCSHCREFHKTLTTILKNNPDTKLVFRHYPVFGKVSLYEAEVALSAAIHDHFEEFHEFLITHEDPVTPEEVKALVEKYGIDYEEFERDRYHKLVGPILMKNVKSAQAFGIQSFPTLIINDQVIMLDELPDVDKLQEMLDTAYNK